MSGPEKSERLAVSLRGLVASLIELVQVRLALAGVEVREEIQRLGELLLYGALSVILLSLGLGFLSVMLTVLLWDSHRLLALSVFTAVFLSLGGLAFLAARARLARGSRLWGASLDELERDKQRLRP